MPTFACLPVLLFGVCAFHFDENLECRHKKTGPATPDGTIEFCILGREGESQGVMPAVFLRRRDGRVDEIWRDRDRDLRPWKLELVELDGDPEPEIALGVYKKARHDPRLAKRLFIYDWTGACLFPKWLGSRLALPLEDFGFARSDRDGLQRLLTIENGPAGKLIRAYRWNGFGFTGIETVLRIEPGRDAGLLYRLFRRVRKKHALEGGKERR